MRSMLAVAMTVAVAGCATTRPLPLTTVDERGSVALRDEFNRTADRPRLLALLSPS